MQLAWFVGVPCNLIGITNEVINNYLIYGKSEQDGTPSVESPAAINSVGNSRLPIEYQEVSHLVFDGNQYIDTGVLTSNTIGYDIEFSTTTAYKGLIGARMHAGPDGSGFVICSFYTAAGNIPYGYVSYGGQTLAKAFTINCLDGNKHKIILNDTTFTIDGVDQEVTRGVGTNFYSVHLGGWTNYGTIDSRIFIGNIDSCKIYDNGSLVRDLVPCYRKSDNKPGFYDLANNVFYPNSKTDATTDFGVGNPVYQVPIKVSSSRLPDAYQEVESLSYPSSVTNSQYSIPLMKFTDCDKIEYTFKSNSTSYSDILLGYSAGGSGWLGFDSQTTIQLTAGGAVSLITTPEGANPTLKGNGQRQTWTFEYDNTSITRSLNAFTIGGYIVASFGQAKTVYEIKCYLNNTLIAHYVPCYRKSDNKTGMYDLIDTNSATAFHANTGSLEFTVGEDIGQSTTTNVYLSAPLRSYGTYSDYIDYENQKVIRQVGYKEFNGTENWSKYSNNTSCGVFQMTLTGKLKGRDLPCSHYPYLENAWDATTGYGISGNPYSNQCTINRGTDYVSSTVQDFKDYLSAQKTAGTPVAVIYPLATPTEEAITLPQLSVPLGNSEVTVDTDIQPLEIQVQGYV